MVDLVTGGAGFIGSHVVARLLREGRTVRVVDDLSTGNVARLADLASAIDIVRADLARDDLTEVVRGAERVFHLAAVPSVPRSVRDPLVTHHSVSTATLRLLIASNEAGAQRFVLSSSSSVYGETAVSPKHEGLPPAPVSPYAVAKVAAENYARVFAQLHGLHTVSLRYFNVFGPMQDDRSAYAAVIPIFVGCALEGQPLPLYGDGSQTRDFTYVDNVVDANMQAAVATVPPGSVYNIAAGQPRTVLDVVRVLENIVGVRLVIERHPDRPGDIKHSHADIGRAREDLGWTPSVSFEEGLRRTVEWFRSR